jgi:hypothetical protein
MQTVATTDDTTVDAPSYITITLTRSDDAIEHEITIKGMSVSDTIFALESVKHDILSNKLGE